MTFVTRNAHHKLRFSGLLHPGNQGCRWRVWCLTRKPGVGRKPRDLVLPTWKKFPERIFVYTCLVMRIVIAPEKTNTVKLRTPSNGPGTTCWSPGHLNEFYALVVYNPNSIFAMKRMLGDLVTHPTCFLQLTMARQVVKDLWKPKTISPRMPRDRWWRGKKNMGCRGSHLNFPTKTAQQCFLVFLCYATVLTSFILEKIYRKKKGPKQKNKKNTHTSTEHRKKKKN